jgi:putative copper resistance protein D
VFTETSLEPVPFVLTVWIAGLYLLGVVVLHRRGDHWPVGRTCSFVVVGLGLFWWASSSGLAAYDTTLLSVHMVQHMVLSMLVPLALALGAPITLALRTLPARPRRWLLVCLHSRVAKVLSFPPLTFTLYVLSPWALYFTGWYDTSTSCSSAASSSGRWWASTPSPAGWPTRSGCCWWSSPCPSTPSSASRSWASRS